MVEKKDAKYKKALQEFGEGELQHSRLRRNLITTHSVDEKYRSGKDIVHKALDISMEAIEAAPDDIQVEYDVIEKARKEYETERDKANAEGRTPPSAENIELRDCEQLQAVSSRVAVHYREVDSLSHGRRGIERECPPFTGGFLKAPNRTIKKRAEQGVTGVKVVL